MGPFTAYRRSRIRVRGDPLYMVVKFHERIVKSHLVECLMEEVESYEFMDKNWNSNIYLVPQEEEQLTAISKYLGDDKQLGRREWLLNCNILYGKPKLFPKMKGLLANASLATFLEWHSVRGWELVDINRTYKSKNRNTHAEKISTVDCLFKRKYQGNLRIKFSEEE